MQESRVNLIDVSAVNTPGSGNIEDGRIPVLLRSTNRISRLAFDIIEPKVINRSNVFKFSIITNHSSLMVPDIINGDSGMPEINIKNQEGEVFRFKRGNLKDFILKVSDGIVHDVEIPISSFIFNHDLKENISSGKDFFSSPIVKVYFDFLGNSLGDIELNVINPKLDVSFSSLLCASKLIDVVRVNNASFINDCVTECGHVSLSLSPNSLCSHLFNDEVFLEIEIAQGKTILDKTSFKFMSKRYYGFFIPRLGEAVLNLKLIHDGQEVARWSSSYVRTLMALNKTKSIGISDATNYEGASHLGSQVHRLVVNLTNVIKLEGGYKFGGDNNPFRNLSLLKGNTIYIAFKGMPKWLSNRDSHDYHRYAPKCLLEYSSLIKWLVSHFNDDNDYVVETWNEANVIHEWNDSIEALSSLHNTAYDAIKSVAPSVLVLSPSSTSWDFDYFDSLLQAGIYDKSDGMSLHGYTYSPEKHIELFEKLDTFVGTLAKLKKGFKAHITEIGFRTPAFTDRQQSEFFTLFSLQAHFLNNIECLIWFRFQNLTPESGLHYDQNSSSGYSMIGYQNAYVKPSYAAFRWLSNVLSLTRSEKIIVDGDETLFVGKYNSISDIVISHSQDEHLSLFSRISQHKFDLYDIYGNKISKNDALYHGLVYGIEK